MTAISQPAQGITGPLEDTDIEQPTGTDEAPPEHRRRRIALLLMLSLLAVVLIGLVIWYLIFRQPLTDILPVPNVTNPPAYQLSLYDLNKPLAVAVTGDGSHVIVTQGSGDRATVMLDGAGNLLATLAPPQNVAISVAQLYVAINPVSGDIYATDRTNGAIFRYSADGDYIETFKPRPDITGWQPLGIAFDAAGNMYVTDVGGAAQRVHVFGPDGTLVRDFGAADQLNYPNGIAVDAAGNAYVADSNNGRLLAFDASGARIGAVARGAAESDLGMPRGVAVDSRGRVYVVDATGQVVQMYRAMQAGDNSPLYLTNFGREGTVDGAFEFPNGVAVDGRGRVYVADWNNNRLQIWSY
jgi:sugar lactone lactonase YvrE